jgi:hypothetical protein
MVTDVFVGDVALCELRASGTTGAPAEILNELRHRGHIDSHGRLTAAGRRRAKALNEAELRRQFADGGNALLKTVADGRRMIYLSGGPARIQT